MDRSSPITPRVKTIDEIAATLPEDAAKFLKDNTGNFRTIGQGLISRSLKALASAPDPRKGNLEAEAVFYASLDPEQQRRYEETFNDDAERISDETIAAMRAARDGMRRLSQIGARLLDGALAMVFAAI